MSYLESDSVNEELRSKGVDLIDAGDRDDTLVKVRAVGTDMVNPAWKQFNPENDLRAAYAQFLGRYDWQWLATLTFRDSIHPEAARKKFAVWIDRINKQAFGRRYKNRTPGVYWALAAEAQRRGALHYHALLAATEDLNRLVSRRDARNHWYELEGIAQVDQIRFGNGAVTNYVAKYVAKEGDLELSESLRSYRTQLLLDASS